MFSNLIESKGRIEGEMGDLSVKISRALRRDGSSKEGVVKGLPGEAIQRGEVDWGRGWKFSRLKGGGGDTTGRGGIGESEGGSETSSVQDQEADKAKVSTSLMYSSSPLVRSPTEVGEDES